MKNFGTQLQERRINPAVVKAALSAIIRVIGLAARRELPQLVKELEGVLPEGVDLSWEDQAEPREIIATAERLSRGRGQANDEKAVSEGTGQDYPRTRLYTILEQLRHNEGAAPPPSRCYPIKKLSPQNIFPMAKAEMGTSAPNIEQEYKELFKEFRESFVNLGRRRESPELWLELYDSLMMIHLSVIPAWEEGTATPDVSLYDHARTTAALAVAMHLYQKEPPEQRGEGEFLMISGDFSGIQKFIFSEHGDTRKYRAKILRGRSFAVSLFTELAADMLCRVIGLPALSMVLNAAGRFTIVAPNTKAAQNAVNEVEKQINKWLIEIAYGENAIGLSTVEAKAGDLVDGNFEKLWEKIAEEAERKKFTRIDLNQYGGPRAGYVDEFKTDFEPALCPLCGKRPSTLKGADYNYINKVGSSCQICYDHIFLGTELVKNNLLAITGKNAKPEPNDNHLLRSIFDCYQVSFYEKNREGLEYLERLAQKKELFKCWDVFINPDGNLAQNVSPRFINGYVPVFTRLDLQDDRIEAVKSKAKKQELSDQQEFDPKTLDHIAVMARNPTGEPGKCLGIEALGILKADVDYLGVLMAAGLPAARLTMARLAGLSRQMHCFFSLYLPNLLKTNDQFKDVYTVFAGGDDLFLIGPWNRIIELARVIRTDFRKYVCENEEVTLSAGIEVQKPHTPLDYLAEASEVALGKSKSAGRDRLTIFNETLNWEEMDFLLEVKKILEEWQKEEFVNNAMLYRVNTLIRMAGEENQLIKNKKAKEFFIDDMDCLRWKSLLVYFTERNVGKKYKEERRQEAVRKVRTQLVPWLEKYDRKLKIPLWTILYDQR